MPLPALPVLLLAGLSIGASPRPDEWPHWGGPEGSGVSRETAWRSRGAEQPLWKAQVGLGYSSFAVQGGRAFTLGHDKELGLDVLYCFDARTGEELWTHAYPSKLWDLYHGGGTLTTPSADGEHVYVSEREGRLQCLAVADGSLVWEHQVAEENKLDLPQWGFAASPVVLGEHLILNYGKVMAFDKRTGAPVWSTPKSYGDAYSTPVELARGGKATLAVFGGKGLVLLAPTDGAEQAFLPWETRYDVNAMTPVVLGERLFLSSGYDHGCALVDLAPEKPAVVWESKVMRNQMSGAALWDDHLYGFDDSVLKCIDLKGQELWRERGLGKGALTIAGGRLLVISEEGELVVAEASPGGFVELSRAKVLDGGICWTVPVLADGLVYVRSHAGEVAVLDHRDE